MRLRIVIIGDSLAMPRVEEGVKIYWEDTWPSLLSNSLHNKFEVLNFSGRAKSSNHLTNPNLINEFIELVKPNLIIIQVGVVDCAPRIFNNTEKRILKRLPFFLRKRLIKIYTERRRYITHKAPLAKVQVKPDRFRKNFERFLELVEITTQEVKIIVIPIIAYLPQMEEKSPGYTSNLRLYNNILLQIIKTPHTYLQVCESLSQNQNNFCPDGYHLSKIGNQQLFRLLLPIVKETSWQIS